VGGWLGFTLCEVLNFEKFGFQSSRIRRIVPARDHLQFKMAAAMRSVVLNSTGVMGFLMLSCCAMMMMIKGSDAQTTYTTFAESQYSNQFVIAWEPSNVWVVNDVLELAVTEASGTAVQSVNKYLFGYFRVGLKLVPNDSAGVLTAFYVSISQSLVIPQLLFHNSIDCNDQYL
jgi:hypothetical protein